MPALQTLLSKGDREALTADALHLMFGHFDLDTGDGELPVAALSALGEGLSSEHGWWLCADPVHMEANQDQLYLVAHQELALIQSEADALLLELNRLYADEAWQFFAPTPQRWYLRLPQAHAIMTVPTHKALGWSVGEVLPQGDDAMAWQRAMTEVQMLFHTSQVNSTRGQQGKLTVSGLWCWGGGGLPAAAGTVRWDRVVTDDPVCSGLARLHNVRVMAPSTVSSPLHLKDAGKVLWVEHLDARREAMASPDDRRHALEQRVFVPLLSMLRRGEVSELVIELPGMGRWRIGRAAQRRWWRWRKPLAELLK